MPHAAGSSAATVFAGPAWLAARRTGAVHAAGGPDPDFAGAPRMVTSDRPFALHLSGEADA